MKVIDLLNKIAKGEEVPKKFINKQNYQTYELINYPCCGVEVTNYKDEDGDYLFGAEYELLLLLNDEVEIIEEEKEIEMLFLPSFEEFRNMTPAQRYKVTAIEYDKLNEIIDVINDMRDKE